MIALTLALLIGLTFSFFALENGQAVNLQFGENILSGVPLYAVILVSMLAGVALSLLISLEDHITTAITLFGKDRKIKSTENAIIRLENRIRELEAENARLRGASRVAFFKQSSFAKPNLFQKVRHRLSL